MISWLTKNWFLAGLVIAVIAAFLFPEAGMSGGWLRSEITTKLAVALLFFIRGALLPLAELRRGILQWQLHLLMHAYIFLVFPLGTLLLVTILEPAGLLPPEVRVGFLFMATLPTTVSTAAVFTSLANGNTVASVFNATLSNCLGVVIVPVWMAWLLQREAETAALGPTIWQMFWLVIVPLAAGQLIKPFAGGALWRRRRALEVASTVLILYVIFAAFANSAASGLWRDHGWNVFAVALVLSLFVFAAATAVVAGHARIVRMSRSDFISLLFCAPQKTLAGGVTLANVLFARDPGLGLILLPLLLYHFIQLFAGGIFLRRLQDGHDDGER